MEPARTTDPVLQVRTMAHNSTATGLRVLFLASYTVLGLVLQFLVSWYHPLPHGVPSYLPSTVFGLILLLVKRSLPPPPPPAVPPSPPAVPSLRVLSMV